MDYSPNLSEIVKQELNRIISLCEEAGISVESLPSEKARKMGISIASTLITFPEIGDNWGIFADEDGGIDIQYKVSDQIAYMHINREGYVFKASIPPKKELK